MFVPVACSRCGKPFQVSDADAGRDVPCPWCGAAVAALPVAAAARPAEPPAPLSLDDDPPPPPVEPLPPRRRQSSPAAVVALGVALLLLVVVLGFGLLGYRSGRIPDSAWRSYTPPDKAFTVDMPGEPTAEPLNPLPGAVGGFGGAMYTARGWYSGADAWAGWRDVQAVVAPAAAGNPETWMLYRPAIDAEVQRQQDEWRGTNLRVATTRFENPLTVEVRMDTPDGAVVERIMVVGLGPRTRLYVVGMRAKNLTPDSPGLKRLYHTFRLNAEGGGR